MRSSARTSTGLTLYSSAGTPNIMLHEVRGVVEVVPRVHERLAHVVLVGHRDDGRQLRDQAVGRDLAMRRVVDVERVVIEGRERAHHAHHHRHRVRIAPEPLVEARQLLVHHGVHGDGPVEPLLLRRVRELPVHEQVAHLQEVAMLGELLDGVAAVQQHARVAVDVGDLRAAARGREESRVVGELAGLAVEGADVDHVRADRARVHRQLQGLAVFVAQCGLAFGFHAVLQVDRLRRP